MTKTITAVMTAAGAALQGYGMLKTATAVSVALRDVIRCEGQMLTIHEEINEWTNRMDKNNQYHHDHLRSLHDRLQLWQARANACDSRLRRTER